MSSKRLIAIIGGTGAQGAPVVRELLQSGDYSVRVLTRDMENPRFKKLETYGPVEGLVGTFASEETLRALLRGAWGAFINIDGFNAGEKTETFWTIRGEISSLPRRGLLAWELAIEEGVKFYVHANIDYAYKKSGFRPEFYCGHYDAKGRLAEAMLAMNKDPLVHSRMRTAAFTTGPYIDMTLYKANPLFPVVEDGIATWYSPINEGAMPFTALDDCGVYVKWLFDNADGEADGMDLEAAIDHITFKQYAEAFTKVTGKPARWINNTIEDQINRIWGDKADGPTGYNADPKDPATMSLRRNFTAFFKLWQNCGGDNPILKRDYALLDRIHPNRIRSVEEWLRRENERGIKLGLGTLYDRVQPQNIGYGSKDTEEQRQGKI